MAGGQEQVILVNCEIELLQCLHERERGRLHRKEIRIWESIFHFGEGICEVRSLEIFDAKPFPSKIFGEMARRGDREEGPLKMPALRGEDLIAFYEDNQGALGIDVLQE